MLYNVARLVDVDNEAQRRGGAGRGQLACPQSVTASHRPVGDVEQVLAVHSGVIIEADAESFPDARVCFLQDFLKGEKRP